MNIRTILTTLLAAAGLASAVPQLDGTYWNSNWDVMYFERSGNNVYSEYIYDNGVITATLKGDTLTGWWREFNNAQKCGPGDSWSGALKFLFDSAGTKFTGSWNYCGDSAALDPNGSGWTGSKRDSGYTQADCGSAGRYWCDGKCRLAPCGNTVTEAGCKQAGYFWCDNACSLAQCGSSAIPQSPRAARAYGARMPMSLERAVDANGRCLDARRAPAFGLYLGQ